MIFNKFLHFIKKTEVPAQDIAVLIDADNVNVGLANVIADCRREGPIALIRIYGLKHSLCSKSVLELIGVEHIELIPTAKPHKDATDFAIIMDAVALCHERRDIGTFAIVSGDSHFTSLVERLKSKGKRVLCCGHQCTAKELKQSCDQFNLLPTAIGKKKKRKQTVRVDERDKRTHDFIVRGYKRCPKADGWALLSEIIKVANHLAQIAKFTGLGTLSEAAVAAILLESRSFSVETISFDVDGYPQLVYVARRKGVNAPPLKIKAHIVATLLDRVDDLLATDFPAELPEKEPEHNSDNAAIGGEAVSITDKAYELAVC